jgi:hypothetical protein
MDGHCPREILINAVAGARCGSLPFYLNHRLIELRFVTSDGPDSIYCLHHPKGRARWLDGKSMAIHEVNDGEPLALNDTTVAA